MLSPTLDLLCVGGLSLVVMVPLLLAGRTDLLLVSAGVQAWIGTAINMPHFMASYRLVYGSRAMIVKHKWASMYVPVILLAYMAFALWQAQESQAFVYIMITVASVYLAWHYTGQVWGMMAAYAALEGTSFDPVERRLVRTSLRILLAWHVAWFLYTQLRDPSGVTWIYQVVSAGTVVAFAVGGYGLFRFAQRTGHRPPTLSLVAWLSLFVWYAVMARDPKALFWVQIAHSIQYLAFPIRMELNGSVASRRTTRTPFQIARHMAVYAAALLVVSILVSQIVPNALMGVVAGAFGEEPGRAAPILILMFINIHHYFTDGVLWKISNPEVRAQLFAHAQPA